MFVLLAGKGTGNVVWSTGDRNTKCECRVNVKIKRVDMRNMNCRRKGLIRVFKIQIDPGALPQENEIVTPDYAAEKSPLTVFSDPKVSCSPSRGCFSDSRFLCRIACYLLSRESGKKAESSRFLWIKSSSIAEWSMVSEVHCFQRFQPRLGGRRNFHDWAKTPQIYTRTQTEVKINLT